ncbi:MAG: tetratricopeptide repeat protein [Spirochaetales bacterium]
MSLPNRKVLERQYEADRRLYELILQDLELRFRTWLEAEGLHAGIKVRVKSFPSWFDKVLKKIRHGVSPERVQVHDVLGIRLVCPFLEDLKRIEELIRRNFEVLEEEKKGAVQSFKEFGYDSTHFLVALPSDLIDKLALSPPLPCEIQVRTILQDAWAEVEHELIYKSKFLPFDQPLKRKMAALNANLTLSDIIFQEIREYQRQLNHELDKRRHHYLATLQDGGEQPREPEAEEHHPTIDNLDQALLDALTAHNRNKYKKAINLYSAILKLAPQPFVQSLVLVHRGMAYFSESLYENALEDFDRAITADPQNSKAFFYRGTVRHSLDEFGPAAADFTRSLELQPYQQEVLLLRAESYAESGRLDDALADCAAALELGPDNEQAQALLHRLTVEKKPRR